MKKRFWTRLISAVLTMAMAFSILAVPASAASENSWASGYLRMYGSKGSMVLWTTELAYRDMMREHFEEDGYSGDRLEELIANSIKYQKEYAQTQGKEEPDKSFFYEGDDIPLNAYAGISETKESVKFWYTKEAVDDMERIADELNEVISPDKINWDTGVYTFSNGESVGPITNTSSAGETSIDGGAAVVAVVGAAAVATGIYFYTHPEKIEEVKAFFADLSANVQAKVQEFTAGVKGAFGIVVPDQEDEETAPVAETALEEQAA